MSPMKKVGVPRTPKALPSSVWEMTFWRYLWESRQEVKDPHV
jgi:hypothetical protein